MAQYGTFSISYALGIQDMQMKKMMSAFSRMMWNGFAHYDRIESVFITFDRLYVIVDDHVKEYVLENEGDLRNVNLRYLTSHDKGGFEQKLQ